MLHEYTKNEIPLKALKMAPQVYVYYEYELGQC